MIRRLPSNFQSNLTGGRLINFYAHTSLMRWRWRRDNTTISLLIAKWAEELNVWYVFIRKILIIKSRSFIRFKRSVKQKAPGIIAVFFDLIAFGSIIRTRSRKFTAPINNEETIKILRIIQYNVGHTAFFCCEYCWLYWKFQSILPLHSNIENKNWNVLMMDENFFQRKILFK